MPTKFTVDGVVYSMRQVPNPGYVQFRVDEPGEFGITIPKDHADRIKAALLRFDDYVDAALCVWDWLCGIQKRNETISALWESYGTAAMRYSAWTVGKFVENLHQYAIQQGYVLEVAFDFELVPNVCEKLDWDDILRKDQYSEGWKPRPLFEYFAQYLQDYPGDYVFVDPYQRWLDEARSSAGMIYRCANLVEDDPVAVAAFESGEKPLDYVQRLGRKYDLTPVRT